MTNIIIGIDPGPRVQSCVAFQGGIVLAVREFTLPSDIQHLMEWLTAVHLQHGWSAVEQAAEKMEVCCEWIESFGMAVGKETFETVFQIGRLQECIGPMRLIPRRDIKLHLCNSVRAKDGNVRQALIDKLGPVGTKKNPGPCYGVAGHYWSALAVAVTASELSRTAAEADFHRGGSMSFERQLEAMKGNWIKLADAMPPFGQDCLFGYWDEETETSEVFCGWITDGTLLRGDCVSVHCDAYGWRPAHVWMPLPEYAP